MSYAISCQFQCHVSTFLLILFLSFSLYFHLTFTPFCCQINLVRFSNLYRAKQHCCLSFARIQVRIHNTFSGYMKTLAARKPKKMQAFSLPLVHSFKNGLIKSKDTRMQHWKTFESWRRQKNEQKKQFRLFSTVKVNLWMGFVLISIVVEHNILQPKKMQLNLSMANIRISFHWAVNTYFINFVWNRTFEISWLEKLIALNISIELPSYFSRL